MGGNQMCEADVNPFKVRGIENQTGGKTAQSGGKSKRGNPVLLADPRNERHVKTERRPNAPRSELGQGAGLSEPR